jgi:hypothetical protein
MTTAIPPYATSKSPTKASFDAPENRMPMVLKAPSRQRNATEQTAKVKPGFLDRWYDLSRYFQQHIAYYLAALKLPGFNPVAFPPDDPMLAGLTGRELSLCA